MLHVMMTLDVHQKMVGHSGGFGNLPDAGSGGVGAIEPGGRHRKRVGNCDYLCESVFYRQIRLQPVAVLSI